jgi:small-conductance mechanosensitive channel
MNPKYDGPRRIQKRAGALTAVWIILFLLATGGILEAAEPSKTPGDGKPSSAPPIAESEIIPRADQTVKSLQKLRSAVAADATLSSIQKDLAALEEKSDRRRESDGQPVSKPRSVQGLNEMQREWSLEQNQLDDWEQALAGRSKILLAQERDVDRIIESWRATQAAVAKKFFFKAVLERRVEEVLREAQATRQAIQEQTTRLLKLQSQVADRLATLGEIRKEIDRARKELSRSLFTLNTPPLWEALFRPGAKDVIGAQVAESARKFSDDLQEFLQKYADRILGHTAFFLVLLILFRVLRRGLTPEAVERVDGSSALLILDRPVATSLLLTLIAVPLFYPEAAAPILRIAILPTVISILRLLPGLLPKFCRKWVYGLVLIYVLDFLRYLLPVDWLLTRLLLLIIAVGGGIGLGLFLRSRGPELSAFGSKERFIVPAARLLLFLFAVSTLCNLIGNMTLAEILVSTPVRVIYAGALIATGAHLLITLTMVGVQSPAARYLRSVREHGERIALGCRTLIRLAAVILWVVISLYTMGILGNISGVGADFLQLRWKLGAAEISVQGLAVFCVVLLSAVVLSRILRFVLSEEILPRFRLSRGVPGAVDLLSRYGVLLLGFFIALAAAGVDLTKVTLLVSALGVGIGFGLQNVVNNFVSGLILVFEHPVQVGDYVEVGSLFGEVRKIGFRASILRTPDGADVVIPNSELVGARFINWSLFDRLRRISISVGAAYGTDPNHVIDILVRIARTHPAVLYQPEPMAVFDRFADSALNFTLLCWTDVDQFFLTRSELTVAINKAFKEAHIEIPFPQQDIHVHWPDKSAAGIESVARLKGSNQPKSDKDPPLLSETESLAKK